MSRRRGAYDGRTRAKTTFAWTNTSDLVAFVSKASLSLHKVPIMQNPSCDASSQTAQPAHECGRSKGGQHQSEAYRAQRRGKGKRKAA
jgi:hypothetical protein